jgi:hypothetical protein
MHLCYHFSLAHPRLWQETLSVCFCPARRLCGRSFMHLAAAMEGPMVEDLIQWLLDVKKHKVMGEKVVLSEPEIRQRSRGGGLDTAGAGREEAQGDGEEGAA